MDVEKIKSVGNVWEKYGKRRVYFDREESKKACGLVVEYYKSGNVSYASLNGEKISNSKGGDWAYSATGVYYDLDTEKWYARGKYAQEAIEAIKNYYGIA